MREYHSYLLVFLLHRKITEVKGAPPILIFYVFHAFNPLYSSFDH